MREKPLSTRARRSRSSKLSAFRSASVASVANVASASRSARVEDPPGVVPADARGRPGSRPTQVIGAATAAAKPPPVAATATAGRLAARRRPASPSAIARPRKPLPGRELAPDGVRVEPVRGGAAQAAPVGVEEVAVGGIGVEQRGSLLDEHLEHGLDVQLAGDDLGRVEQRALPFEAELVLPRADAPCGCRDPSSRATASASARSIRSRHAGRPGGGRSTPIVRSNTDDRRRQHGAGAERRAGHSLPPRRARRATSATATVALRAHRPPFETGRRAGERRAGSRRGGPGLRRSSSAAPPASPRRRGSATRPSAARRLLDGDPQHGVEVELRAHLARDRRHEPLAVERVLERRRRPGTLEREGGLGGERPQRPELLRREGAPLARGRDHEHGDHPLAGEQRDERGALARRPPRQRPG